MRKVNASCHSYVSSIRWHNVGLLELSGNRLVPKAPRGSRAADLLNPAWKALAGHLSGRCERCGTERLLSAFAYYATGRPPCRKCLAAAASVKPLIHVLFGSLGIEATAIGPILEDPLVARCMLGIVKGIARFGLMHPQPAGAPIVIVWNFTNRCNLNCLHCHQDSSPQPGGRELTTDEAFRVIRDLSDAGVAILSFSGGEPLLRADVYDAVGRARDGGMLCTVASNGTLLTREVAERLARAGVRRVEIGLDGARAETHDFLRNQSGSFEGALQGIRNCAALGFDEVAVTMTLHSGNAGELEETMALAEGLGATRFYLNRLIPAGRGREAIRLDVGGEAKRGALEALYRKFYDGVASGGMQCYARGMTYYSRLGFEKSGGRLFSVSESLSGYEKMFQERFGTRVADIVRALGTEFGGCSVGLTYAGLTASGDLIPCIPAPIRLGNLLQERLEDIWVNSDVLNYVRRRQELKGNCGGCAYRSICGGCRYTAFVLTGDWLGVDPSCPYGPAFPQQPRAGYRRFVGK